MRPARATISMPRSFSFKGKYLADLGALNLYVIADYNENHGIAGIFDNTYRQVDADSVNLAPLAT
jgi:iron complex outermembrane receptor protein